MPAHFKPGLMVKPRPNRLVAKLHTCLIGQRSSGKLEITVKTPRDPATRSIVKPLGPSLHCPYSTIVSLIPYSRIPRGGESLSEAVCNNASKSYWSYEVRSTGLARSSNHW